jgi:molybdopterin synthase catalytic subunit
MTPIIVTDLTHERIDAGAVVAQIRREDCGGLASFEGSTRSPSDGRVVVELSYEAYEERARTQLSGLAAEAAERWGLGGVVAVHRVGVVPPGEPSVLVAASAPHREQAFAAARWLIDTVKAEVAIWKKEIFEDGEAWVGVEPQ